ncbi:MAG: hypothetical protein H6Q20_1013 [Bacteroidetes bacterium]|nr:hypothetical protein [Bacteroidota bacterium]
MNRKTPLIKTIFLLILLILASKLTAQETIVVGQVYNSTDRTPVPDVNIFFKNTTGGTKTNDEGFFMLRYHGQESVLVFSCVGYRRKEIKIKPGMAAGVEVLLREENTLLQEVFVVPGVNPAIELMRRIRLMRSENDVTRNDWYQTTARSSQLALLNKVNKHSVNRKIYEQLLRGNTSNNDSALAIPVFMSESDVLIRKNERKYMNENIFSSEKQNEEIVRQMLDDSDFRINFYNNAVSLYGKSFISPLSAAGSLYYNFYLTDSLWHDERKQYTIRFHTKNPKNLAFVGDMTIDSASLALTSITAYLPNEANINFVRNLGISQKFTLKNKRWLPDYENTTISMTYNLPGDSVYTQPELFVKRSLTYNTDSLLNIPDMNFAGSGVSSATLDEKLSAVNNTPVMKFAHWLADIILTGYIPAGKFDIGKIQQLGRLTDAEGLRLNIPLRTNEHLWPNVCIGGYAGYAFRPQELKYSVYAQYRLPVKQKSVFSLGYTDDYRRIDYDYNDFLTLENPLETADVDIAGTLLSFKEASHMNGRKEFSASFSTDLNNDIEAALYFRSNKIYQGAQLPFQVNGTTYEYINNRSITLKTRFSFGQRTYEDHLQRIYANNYKPVIYALAEAGTYALGNTKGNYARLSGTLSQRVLFDYGRWDYMIEGAYLLGSVPYPLLNIATGSESSGFKRYNLSMIKFMEFATDRYMAMHNELTFDGILFNQIPLIKHLSMREMFSFKVMYGGLSNKHRSLLDFPETTSALNKPYAEVGVGVTNLLHFLTIQSVWRLTSHDHTQAEKWRILTVIRITL